MKNLPFVKAADVEGEYRIPPRVSKFSAGSQIWRSQECLDGDEYHRGRQHDPRSSCMMNPKKCCSSLADVPRSSSKAKGNGKLARKRPSTPPLVRNIVWKILAMSRSGSSGYIAPPFRLIVVNRANSISYLGANKSCLKKLENT